jgi:hypothetical protein
LILLHTDEFIPPESLKRLVEHDKDNVGYPTPMWHKDPCVFKEGGFVAQGDGTFKLNHYSWEELFRMQEDQKSQLLKVHSVGNGCLLSKKKVYKKVAWCSPHFPPIAEDTLFYVNCEKYGFESWVDMGIIPLHLPVGWNNIPGWKEDILFGKHMAVAHGWVTDDDPKERPIHWYEPGDGTPEHTEDEGTGNK